MRFHLRPCLLKSIWNLLKYSASGIFSSLVPQKMLLDNKAEVFEATSKRFRESNSVHEDLSFDL